MEIVPVGKEGQQRLLTISVTIVGELVETNRV